MMTQKRDETICTIGHPEVNEAIREVIAFHLHRYLSLWLRDNGIARVLVSVGFERSRAQSVTYAVGFQGAQIVEVRWSFDDLCHTHHYGGGRLEIECGADEEGYESLGFALIPVYDGEGSEARSGLIAFALLVEADEPRAVAVAETELALQIGEALRAARRNSMRLFFDEKKHLPMKAFLYEMLDHLPGWIGCDHSVALILTSNLDAMTLDEGGQARFGVLAERIFFAEAATSPCRLVGMEIDLDEDGGVLARAVDAQRQDPRSRGGLYLKRQGGWVEVGTEEVFSHFHDVDDRPEEATLLLVPLMIDGGGESEMLGFLSISQREDTEFGASSRGLLDELAIKLSDRLRYSPLYMLSAHKMWILGQVRGALERTLKQENKGAGEALEGYIGEVTRLISRHVDVPSIAIAYLMTPGAVRAVRYVHPHGWTHFDGLELAIDVAVGERADSGVSALAMRLGRPLVLAGGYGQGEGQGFKNDLFVHEEDGRILDGRSLGARNELAERGWVPLKAYYKPARKTAYATLAYPVIFAERVLGVVTIEVERDTDWLWWTGFGGQLFWQWLAADLAYAFSALGV